MNFISIRQRYLVSPQHRLRSSARTILVRNIPPDLRSIAALDALFDVFPDGIRKIWFNRDYTRLENAVLRRNHFAWMLEYGLTDMMRLAELKHRKKADRNLAYKEGDPLWMKYVKPSERPRMHVPRFRSQRWTRFIWFWLSWPFGLQKSVDQIDYCSEQIDRLSKKIKKMHEELDQFPSGTSAFIQFNSQVAAHMAVQSNIHHSAALMSPRQLEIAPSDVRWGSLNIHWWSIWIRNTLFVIIFVGIIFLWGVPITFAGFLSSISTVGTSIPWLAWVATLPSWAISVVQGTVPQLLTQLLITTLIPLLLRLLCGLTGTSTGALRELQLQGWYFTFVFVEVVLVVSISSGIIAAISSIIANPFSGTAQLAQNLPKASNFFISYIILQGLSISAANLLHTPRLLYMVWRKCFNYSPRSDFINRTWCPHNLWGSTFPLYTNMACIGIIYSIVSPVVLIFSTCQFALFLVVFRNNSMFVYKNDIDTGGLLFSKAVFQLFTGVYFLELVLICLFFLNQDRSGKQSCIGQAVIMIVVAAGTILYHWQLYQKTQPLINFLPITLEDDAVIADKALAEKIQHNKSMAEKIRPSGASDSNSRSEGDSQSVDLRPSTSSHARPHTASIDTNSMRDLHYRRRPTPASDDPEKNAGALQKTSTDYAHIGEVVGGFDDELEDLNKAERDELVDDAFTNPVIRRGQTCVVWIPRDDLGIAQDEIARLERLYGGQTFGISTEGARFAGKKYKTLISGIPPDFEKTWIVEKLL